MHQLYKTPYTVLSPTKYKYPPQALEEFSESSGTVWKSRWLSWAPLPVPSSCSPYGLRGRKATLNLTGPISANPRFSANWCRRTKRTSSSINSRASPTQTPVKCSLCCCSSSSSSFFFFVIFFIYTYCIGDKSTVIQTVTSHAKRMWSVEGRFIVEARGQ